MAESKTGEESSSVQESQQVASSSGYRSFYLSDDNRSQLPSILRGSDILVPIKVDVTNAGARFVDTFCWNINSSLTSYDYAARTCADLNLPSGFITKIALQIAEQVQAFIIIIKTLKELLVANTFPSIQKLREPSYMAVGIRFNTLDYSDKFVWDPMADISPEKFACITCSDLGLPPEMEPAIAHKIRENLFRNFIVWLDDPQHFELPNAIIDVPQPSEVKVTLVPPHQAIEMSTNLWKRAKPSSVDEQASVPQPLMPTNKDTNASIWKSSSNLGV